jgi:murein DD-endopeptidase MepM/ murein hydrolase activator NlpD
MAKNRTQASDDNTSLEVEQTIEFLRPLREGWVTAPFGPMIHPFTKKEAFHRGIDIAVRIGTDVYAVADGIVLAVPEESDGYGKNLIIQHADEFSSRYAKLSDILVTEGQAVKAGERIALSGNTGISTGPHLHFELLLHNKHEDPADWIEFPTLSQ